MNGIVVFAVTTIITLIIDGVWLGFIANKLYLQEIGHLMRKNAQGTLSPLWAPAILVYIVIPLALCLFVIPKVMGKPMTEAFLWGALFGALTYAVYDLTNLATLNNWSVKIAFIDIIWGAVLCGTVTALVVSIVPHLLSK